MEVRPGYKQTDIGVIPDDWETETLEEICIPGGLVRGPFGGAIKKEFFVRDGYKVYEQRNAIYRDADLGSYFIDENKYRELRRFEVKEGDFIVSCSGTIGRIFQIPKDARAGVINQALLKIKIDDCVVHDEFFFYVFDWDKFQQRIIDNTQGGAMHNLVGMDVFRNTLIPTPPLPEQRAIAAVLSDVDTLIAALARLIAKKRAIKQGAMQQLLTGQTRLPGFSGPWETRRLGEILDYEQPSEYLVKDAEYTDTGIPVLTAGKTFILGYTDEQEGIYRNLPVIVFDDFTTASRYVDFPFKVKSSAIKLLRVRNGEADLQFVFGKMQILKFAVGDHKRYYSRVRGWRPRRR